MTEKQMRFCEEYLVDLNASQALIRAGYSPNYANSNATKVLQTTVVRARIDEALAEQSRRTGITADRVIRELARVAFVSAPDVIDMEDATVNSLASVDDLAAIASVRVKKIPTSEGTGIEREVRLADKLKALELLGRHLGMFTDNVRLSGDLGVQIINDIPKDTG